MNLNAKKAKLSQRRDLLISFFYETFLVGNKYKWILSCGCEWYKYTKCIQISIHYSNLCMTIYCKILHQKYNQIYLFMKTEPWLWLAITSDPGVYFFLFDFFSCFPWWDCDVDTPVMIVLSGHNGSVIGSSD